MPSLSPPMSPHLIKFVKLVEKSPRDVQKKKKKKSKRKDAVSVGSKYHVAQHSPVNNVDFVSETVFVCSTNLTRHKATVTLAEEIRCRQNWRVLLLH